MSSTLLSSRSDSRMPARPGSELIVDSKRAAVSANSSEKPSGSTLDPCVLPAGLGDAKLRDRPVGAVGRCQPEAREEVLVAVRRHDVGADRRRVECEDTHRLRRVESEPDASRATEFADRLERRTRPRDPVDALRQTQRVRSVSRRSRSSEIGNGPHANAAVLEVQERRQAPLELELVDDDLVARAPVRAPRPAARAPRSCSSAGRHGEESSASSVRRLGPNRLEELGAVQAARAVA